MAAKTKKRTSKAPDAIALLKGDHRKVAGLFNQSFADGWSQLNKLSGTYLHGAELTAYLQEAGNRLTAISQERQKNADARIADLDVYRKALEREALESEVPEREAA